jgi:hypothetical protein
MSANGISTLSTKLARQTAKLDIAQLKRKGYATIVQNTTAYAAGTDFPFADIKITVNNVDDVYLHFYNPVPAISNQLKVGMIVTIDWDGRAPNTVAYIASQLIDFPGHDWRAQGLGFLLTIITTTELPGNSEDYNIEALHIPNGTFAGSGTPSTSVPFYRARNTYNLSLLPDTYATGADDNANTGGLVQGRPWYDPNTEATYNGEVIEVNPGIWRTNYQNYYFENGNFFDTAALKTGGAAYNGPTSDISIPDLPEYTSIMLKGYMRVTYTGTYTFYVDCDDGAYMWFGDNAIDNWKNSEGGLINYDINNGGEHGQQEVAGTVNLTAGNYIPLRVAFGNNGGPGILIVSYSHTGQAKTSDFTGKIFYRTATNGF